MLFLTFHLYPSQDFRKFLSTYLFKLPLLYKHFGASSIK